MSSLKLNAATGGGSVALTGPNSTTSNLAVSLKLPVADGSANQILKTDGSGQLGWATDNSGISLSGSTNNTICTVTGANAIQGEGYLTFDGSHLTQTIDTDGQGFNQIASGNYYIDNIWDSNRSSAGSAIGRITGKWNGTEVASIKYLAGADTTNKDDAHITFWTSSAANNAERLRITSAGDVGIGDNNPNIRLTVVDTGTENLVRLGRSDNSSHGSHTVNIKASKDYYHIFKMEASSYQLHTYTGSAMGERFRITSAGKVGVGVTAPGRQLHVKSGANNNDGAFRIESAPGNIMDAGTDSTGHFLNCVNADPFRIKFAGTEKLRIASDGDVEVKTGDLDIETAGKGVKFPNSSFTESSVNMHLNIASGNNDFYVQSGGTTFAAFKGQSKDLQVTSGNLVIGTSGKGIDFSATSHYSTSGDGEVLTTYEEGTWTPQPMFGGANTGMTYTSRTGTYVRVGKMVTAYYEIVFTSKGSSTGHFQIGGFPWTNSQTEMVNNSFGYFHRFIFGADSTYMITCNLSGTTCGWRYAVHGTSSSGINMAVVTNAHVSDATHVSGALVYRTS